MRNLQEGFKKKLIILKAWKRVNFGLAFVGHDRKKESNNNKKKALVNFKCLAFM